MSLSFQNVLFDKVVDYTISIIRYRVSFLIQKPETYRVRWFDVLKQYPPGSDLRALYSSRSFGVSFIALMVLIYLIYFP